MSKIIIGREAFEEMAEAMEDPEFYMDQLFESWQKMLDSHEPYVAESNEDE